MIGKEEEKFELWKGSRVEVSEQEYREHYQAAAEQITRDIIKEKQRHKVEMLKLARRYADYLKKAGGTLPADLEEF